MEEWVNSLCERGLWRSGLTVCVRGVWRSRLTVCVRGVCGGVG